MAYNEKLADRIRKALDDVNHVKETRMMGGLTFMVNDKMCLGIFKDEMMCRIDPATQETVLQNDGCRIMDFTGRPMKGYVLVNDFGMKTKQKFDYWIDLCLAFNEKAKSSKKKSKHNS